MMTEAFISRKMPVAAPQCWECYKVTSVGEKKGLLKADDFNKQLCKFCMLGLTENALKMIKMEL